MKYEHNPLSMQCRLSVYMTWNLVGIDERRHISFRTHGEFPTSSEIYCRRDFDNIVFLGLFEQYFFRLIDGWRGRRYSLPVHIRWLWNGTACLHDDPFWFCGEGGLKWRNQLLSDCLLKQSGLFSLDGLLPLDFYFGPRYTSWDGGWRMTK